MNTITSEVELREIGGDQHLYGVMIQEGRAASSDLLEIFVPGSVEWPASGVGIMTEHRGEPEVHAHPVRAGDGRITIRARATDAIKRAVENGKRYMSVEFHSLKENRTKTGVREVLKAFVTGATVTSSPVYSQTSAEVREKPNRRRVWL